MIFRIGNNKIASRFFFLLRRINWPCFLFYFHANISEPYRRLFPWKMNILRGQESWRAKEKCGHVWLSAWSGTVLGKMPTWVPLLRVIHRDVGEFYCGICFGENIEYHRDMRPLALKLIYFWYNCHSSIMRVFNYSKSLRCLVHTTTKYPEKNVEV